MKKILFALLMSLLATVAFAKQQTPKPEIYVDEGPDACDVWAYGEGEVHLFLDNEEVEIPYRINKDYVEQCFLFEAYAEEEGCYPSEWVSCEVIVPPLEGPVPPVDPDYGVNVTITDESVILEPYADPAYFNDCTYVIRLYIDGVEVEYPYTLPRSQEDYVVCVTVQIDVEGLECPFVCNREIVVPAFEQGSSTQPLPEFIYTVTDESVIVDIYWDYEEWHIGDTFYYELIVNGEQFDVPCILPRCDEDYLVDICCNVIIYDGDHEWYGPTVSTSYTVPALEPIQPDSRYDVNGDGEVNIADVNVINNAILSNTFDEACDVNNDGEVNIADINDIINYIISK
jgi:hypothetical protein